VQETAALRDGATQQRLSP